jgi:Tfp pilus assembly protein PilX
MALGVALLVLLVVGLLASAAIDAAVRTNGATRDDASRQAALAAADAGLAVATYRLSMLLPDANHCVAAAVSAPVGTVCPIDGPESLGNGSSFRFQASVGLTGGVCAGQTVQNAQQPVTDRCVTAIGTANGVSARTQARVDAWAAQPFFPYPGITGLNGVAVSNNAIVNAGLASNGKVTLSSNVVAGAIFLGDGTGSLQTGSGVTTGTVTQAPKVGAAAVPVGNSATTNSNGRIASHLDSSSGAVAYTAATRTLALGNGASLTLGGTVYNFCNLTMSNNTSLTVAAGVRTELIIDSPDDPNSAGCPPGSGGLHIANNALVATLSGVATALQIYVYGWNNGRNVVDFSNNGASWATIYAPQSTVNLTNNGVFTGAILGLQVNLINNVTFAYGADAATMTASTQGLYYRSAWQQCPAAPINAGDLSSGC